MSMISVDYDVLNQRGSPAWYSDVFASIPTPGYKGRMFISTDTFAFYRDTGTGWDLIGGPGIGTLTGSGTTGQVSFFNGTQTITGSNNLFWDNINSRLGIGTITPGQPLDIHFTGNTLIQLNNTSTGNSNISFQNQDVAKWRVGNVYNAGANSFDIQNAVLSNTPISISSTTSITTFSTTTNMSGLLQTQVGIYLNQGVQANALAPYTAISGRANGLHICPNSGTGYDLIFPSSSSYQYTFPASNGTIALTSNLSSYVPYTGANQSVNLGTNVIYSNSAFIEGNGTTYGGALVIKQYVSSITTGTGYTCLFAGTSSLGITFGTSNSAFFDGSTISANRTYTLPNATGTLALTSDLSSYLPLTGGTLTGQLYINPTNTAIVGLDVASNTARFRSDNLEGFKRQLEITMGSGTLVQLTAKGYGANYGTDLAFYTATTGGTNASPGIYITGTNNRVGIKTGTPAYDLDLNGTFGVSGLTTFASNVTIGSPSTDPTLNLNGDNSGGDSYINFKSDLGQTKVQLLGTKNGGTGGRLTIKTLQSSVLTNVVIVENNSVNINSSRSTASLVVDSNLNALTGIDMRDTGTTGGAYIYFQNSAGNQAGIITHTTSTTILYTSTSDYRLKENVKTINNGLNRVLNLKPVTYKWINSINEYGEGFLAHELQEIVPYAVAGVKDELKEDGSIKPQSIDNSRIVPILVKAIQELNEKLVRNNIN